MSHFLSIQARGTVSLPPALRRRYGLDEPGAQVEIIDDDGQIILRPKIAVDASQKWFWEPQWQAGEAEAEKELQQGEGKILSDGDELLEHLDSTA